MPDHVGRLSETNISAPEISLSHDEALNLADLLHGHLGGAAERMMEFLRALSSRAVDDPKGRAFGTIRVTNPVGREHSRF